MSESTTYSQTRWTKEIDRALAKMTDFDAAQKFGIRRAAIRKRRGELGLLRYREDEPKWKASDERLLGTMPDTELAQKLNIRPYWIRKRRIDLGIEAYQIPPEPATELERRDAHQWTQAEIETLGTQPDTVIAEHLNMSPGCVTRHRNLLGIAPFRRGGPVEWTKGMLRLLGEVPDGNLAKEYEVSPASVKIRRIELGIPPYGSNEMDREPQLPLDVIEQIGKKTDQRLSLIYGVSRLQIRIYRALHKIPAKPLEPKSLHKWTKAEDALLGTISDRRAAAKIGVTAGQVLNRRRKLGIPVLGKDTTLRWTEKRIALLGTEPDHVLAKLWNVTQGLIREKRESLGIPKCERTSREIPALCIDELGTTSDNVLAERYGMTPTVIRNLRTEAGIPPFKTTAPFQWTANRLKKLGTQPDDELAVLWGVSPAFVAKKRSELNLPARRRPTKVDWQDPKNVALLGTMSDGQLAKKLNVTAGAVALQRRNRNIAPFGS